MNSDTTVSPSAVAAPSGAATAPDAERRTKAGSSTGRSPQSSRTHRSPRTRQAKQSHTNRTWWGTPWLFLAFGLIIVGVFTLLPFIQTMYLSFTDATRLKSGQFVGLDNFIELFHDPRFWNALLNSSLYVIVVVPLMVLLPLLLAMLVNSKVPFASFFRTSYYIPVIASVVAVGLIWTWMLDSRGLVNGILKALHIITEPIPFLSDRWLLLFSSMGLTVWMGLGYYMVIYLAALTNVSQDLYEAAALDGAGAWRKFWSVTVPGVRNTMVLVGMLSAVAAFRVFTEVYVLSGNSGGPGGKDITIVMLIQREGSGLDAQVGYSSAISLVMFVITIGLMIAVLKGQGKDSSEA